MSNKITEDKAYHDKFKDNRRKHIMYNSRLTEEQAYGNSCRLYNEQETSQGSTTE